MLPNFKWPKPEDAGDEKLIRDIIDHKCHIITIPEDEVGPGYSFSIGFHLHFSHPEIVLFGLKHETAGVTINQICSLIQEGRRFQNGDTVHELFEGHPVTMVEVDRKFYRDYLGTALWFYRSISRLSYPATHLAR